jgi:hypothetical protein
MELGVYRVGSFVMVLCAVPYKVAHRRGVKSQMARYFALPICISLNSLSHLLVTFSFVPEYTLLEYSFKCRAVCIPLTPRYLWHMLVSLQVISKGVYEFVFAQDDLPLNIEHDRFFTDSPFNKLAIFLFCFASLPAELAKNPIRCEAGVGLFFACGGTVAAPFPLLGAFHHSCPKGI